MLSEGPEWRDKCRRMYYVEMESERVVKLAIVKSKAIQSDWVAISR